MTTTYSDKTTRPRQLLRERHQDVLACIEGLARARAAYDHDRIVWWMRKLQEHVPRLVEALLAQVGDGG